MLSGGAWPLDIPCRTGVFFTGITNVRQIMSNSQAFGLGGMRKSGGYVLLKVYDQGIAYFPYLVNTGLYRSLFDFHTAEEPERHHVGFKDLEQ